MKIIILTLLLEDKTSVFGGNKVEQVIAFTILLVVILLLLKNK